MLTKKEYNYIQEVGTREESFDWDIRDGYIRFGTYGMSVHKLIKKVWHEKFVGDWRNKPYKQLMEELKNQEWRIEE